MQGQVERLPKIAILFMLLTWGWVWDFFHLVGSYQRIGRVKAFLFGVAAVASYRIGQTWHWSIGLFYAYIGLHFAFFKAHLFFGMGSVVVKASEKSQRIAIPDFGMVELVLITGTLFLIPEIYKRVSLRSFENTVLFAGAINAVFGILNHFGIHPFMKVSNPAYIDPSLQGKPVGLIGQHTLLSPFLVFTAAIALHRLIGSTSKRGSLVYFYIMASSLCVAFLTESMMGFLSLGAATVVFILFYLGYRLAVITSLVGLISGAIAVYLHPSLGDFSGRLGIWAEAIGLIKQRMLFGYGTGSWSVIAKHISDIKVIDGVWTQLHSDPLQAQFDWGMVGMGLIGIFLLKILGRAHFALLFKRRELVPYISGAAIFGVNSLGNFTLHITPLGQITAFCLYVILKESDGR